MIKLIIFFVLTHLVCAQEVLPATDFSHLEKVVNEQASRIELLEFKLSELSRSPDTFLGRSWAWYEDDFMAYFVCATLCSLWGMYTRRSSILWFVFGFLFAPFALFVLLILSSRDLNRGRSKSWV